MSNKSRIKEKKELPVRFRYRLKLTNRQDITINQEEYQRLKTIGLIRDKKEVETREGENIVMLVYAKLVKSLDSICTAGQYIDSKGKTNTVIMVLQELQQYVSDDVARQLASFLGKLIRNHGKAA